MHALTRPPHVFTQVAHRDLKPGNILLDERCTHAKLCDFGFAIRCTRATAARGRAQPPPVAARTRL